MSVNEVKVTVAGPKEFVDAFQKLEDIVTRIANKEPIPQQAVEDLTTLVALVPDLGALPADAQQVPDQCIDVGALFGRRLAWLLLGKPVSPVVVS